MLCVARCLHYVLKGLDLNFLRFRSNDVTRDMGGSKEMPVRDASHTKLFEVSEREKNVLGSWKTVVDQ